MVANYMIDILQQLFAKKTFFSRNKFPALVKDGGTTLETSSTPALSTL
jgi:hypothetical protein